ncbi:MAG TPA: hypothetical protein VE130_11620 [Nitrososphaeraceae archaeon]|nr:hypothetical protein [Nitrososphaeraceae archaeon]
MLHPPLPLTNSTGHGIFGNMMEIIASCGVNMTSTLDAAADNRQSWKFVVDLSQWKKLSPILRNDSRIVYTPTLTGLAVANKSIGLTFHMLLSLPSSTVSHV